jgi:hypothetical protein
VAVDDLVADRDPVGIGPGGVGGGEPQCRRLVVAVVAVVRGGVDDLEEGVEQRGLGHGALPFAVRVATGERGKRSGRTVARRPRLVTAAGT